MDKVTRYEWHGSGIILVLLAILVCAAGANLPAQEGHWDIIQLPITNAFAPSINNTGEIVWDWQASIYSSRRGKLADNGINPHIANSGEVVYASWREFPAVELVSTTRGALGIRLFYGIQFDVNAHGEVVYAARDTNNFFQIFSTLRDQITFDPGEHSNPCINDLGEIAWNEETPIGAIVFSTTRGMLTDRNAGLLDLNNAGDFCFADFMEGPPGFYSAPHLFSSAHGALINDFNQLQWGGSLNDVGTIVWEGPPDQPGINRWHLYQAKWVQPDTTPPRILSLTATPDALWPPNHRLVQVKLTVNAVDDLDPSPSARITRVTSNESPTFPAPDWEFTGPLSLNLRADRLANGKGRVYTITVQCQDATGNISSAAVEVRVPHDKKGEK